MKKTFLVEVDYIEKNEADVLYDLAMEIGVESFMKGYVETGSIDKDYNVNVREVTRGKDFALSPRTRYVEQARYALEQQEDGMWYFIKNRAGDEYDYITDGEEFIKNNKNTVLFYSDNSMNCNFKLTR